MSERPPNYFWDSCVFTAFLQNENDLYDTKMIAQFLRDLRQSKCKIYTSSIAMAEVLPSQIKNHEIGDFNNFVNDFSGSIIPVDPNPNIMQIAGLLKDMPYNKSGGKRHLGTGDAIMLSSYIYINEIYDVDFNAFHTYDNGKKRGLDGGKGVPMLTYQEWCADHNEEHRILSDKIIAINRCHPIHPSPDLFTSEESDDKK